MTEYLFPVFVGVCLFYIAVFVIPKTIREQKEQLAKEVFMEETPITVIFSIKEDREEYYTLHDFDFFQEWLYKKAQLGEAATIKIVLEKRQFS